jgi:pantothenate kinase type III
LEAQQETAARNTAKALEDNEKRRQALLEVIDETSTAVQNIADAEQEIADALADAEKKRQKTDEILAQAEAAERQAEAYKKMLETMESMKKLFAEMAKNAPKFRSETSIGTPETKDVSPFKGFDFTTWAGVDTSELAPMEVPEVLIETTDYWKKLGETITETTTLTSIFSDAILGIGDAFEGIFNKTKGGFKDMVTSILEGLNQVITGLLAEAIAATITGSMKTAKNPIVGLALAAVGTGLLLALWKSKVPEFASGGLVYGDTLARVGEYPGAKQNPEVIAPLSKLQGLLQNRAETHVFVHGEFDGRVLRLVQDYSETIERRSR